MGTDLRKCSEEPRSLAEMGDDYTVGVKVWLGVWDIAIISTHLKAVGHIGPTHGITYEPY
jgi:hypothetical protein